MFLQALKQANISGEAGQNALSDPRHRLAIFDTETARIQAKIENLNNQLADFNQQATWNWGDIRNVQNQQRTLPDVIAQEQANLASHLASRPFLEQQATEQADTRALVKKAMGRFNDILEGNLSVLPQEEQFIKDKYEAGIAGLKSQLPSMIQNEATTRGLNRTDVPVMQSVAGPLAGGIASLQSEAANALLGQANANRSLFTGIQQFNQGIDLSNRQLALGLAGQNPAANLTGVYSGLRSSLSTLNTKQSYGALDYVDAASGGASAAGDFMAGYKAK